MTVTTTALADLQYGPEYTSYGIEKAIELNAFVQSGVAQEEADLNTLAAGQGGIYNMPFFKQLATTAPNASSDDDSAIAARRKTSTGMEAARLHCYNAVWSSADLAKAFIAVDPLSVIATQTAQYWATWGEQMIINTALGILASNIANNSSDMLINISAISDSAATGLGYATGAAARQLQANTLIDAMQTAGDHKGMFTAIAMHSAVHANLQKQGAIETHFFELEDSEVKFDTFMGKRVVMDDQMTVASVSIDDGGGASAKNVYTSILFAGGQFRLGYGTPKVPTENYRDPKAGNGGGVEDLIERRHPIVHPVGFKWTDASIAGKGATAAELATAANWTRVRQRKNIGLAFMKTRLD